MPFTNAAGFAETKYLNFTLYKHVVGTPYSDIEEVFIYQPSRNYGRYTDIFNRPRVLTPELDVNSNIEYFIRDFI